MIACIGKNNRGRFLFEELHKIDERFVDLGVIEDDRSALWSGLLKSATWDIGKMKRDARFSSDYRRAMTRQCIDLIDSSPSPIEGVVYWGATNMPVDPKRHKFPWYVVTDGPFDPNDPAYPVEWKPSRWSRSYFDDQAEIFHSATHVFTLSEWARKKIISVHVVSPDKVTKIGWGPLGCIGPPIKLPEGGKKIFLSVGSDWYRKGMDIVAEAGAMLAEERDDVETIIIGEPNGLTLESLKGVTIIPRLLPWTIIHTLMRQSATVVVASRFDASPHVISEALQYQVPVIGSRVCGIAEPLVDTNGCQVIDRITASGLSEAMRQALMNDKRPPAIVRGATWNEAAEVVAKQILLS